MGPIAAVRLPAHPYQSHQSWGVLGDAGAAHEAPRISVCGRGCSCSASVLAHRKFEEVTMWTIRKMIMIGAAAIAAGAAWLVESAAQENAGSGAGVVTVFDHAKLDASFANSLAKGDSAPLWSQTSSNGTSVVGVRSRDSTTPCPPQGCSHKGYVAMVIVVSGAATLEVGGTTKAAGADKFGGQLVQGGESHRISQGDVFMMPPDTTHWYKDITTPFHYITVPVR
jgi:mannose-6-phosphate isomerase-like protein (cupin superfamily)